MMNMIPTIMSMLTLLILMPSMFTMLMSSSYIIEWELCSIFSTSMKMELMLEWSSMLYSSIVLFISANVLKFSKEYMKDDQNNLRFLHIVLMFIMSMNMLIYIPNIMFMLIGWDGLGITSFLLIIYYTNSRSLSAGMLTMMMNRLGDVFLLMSISISLNMGNWSPIYNLMSEENFLYQWIGILMAAMTKSAQMPYSSWLPAAMAAPTPVSALVHSSTLVTAGIFILYRFNTMISNSKLMQTMIMISGMSTILMAGMSAIYENDMKKIIALSTLSQLGLMMIPIAINMPMLAFFHMSVHAMFKALLFITAGMMMLQNNHNQDLRLYGLSFNSNPMTMTAMLISSMALMGVPFMSGYYSKHMIMTWSSMKYMNMIIYFMLLMMIMLTSMYSLRLFIFITMTPMKKTSLMNQKNYFNLNSPLMIMSLMSIITGSTIQWLTPLKEMSSMMEENSKMAMPKMMMILSVILLILMITKLNLLKFTMLNKTFSSLMFMVSMSSQFLLPMYMNLSLLLYKHLDQSWLEKLSSLGPSYKLSNTSSYLNLLMTNYPQNNLLSSISSSMLIFLLLWTIK